MIPPLRGGTTAMAMLALLGVGWVAAAPEQWSLRGYGAFNHTPSAPAGGGVSAHGFRFADPAHARIFVSKLYGDFELTRGNTLPAWTTPRGDVDAVALPGGGFVLPLIAVGSADVTVLTGTDRAALLAAVPPAGGKPLRRAELTHPQFMDKWDRYCLGVWERIGDPEQDTVRPERDRFFAWLGEIGLNPQLNVGTEAFDLAVSDNQTLFQRRYMAKYGVKYQRVEWLFHQTDLYNRNPFLTETLNPHVATRWSYYGERTLAGSPLRDVQNASFLAALKPTLADPNQMALLDPDGEIGPFEADRWGLYGPVAQREFVRFLREVRGLSIEEVSRRYTGAPGTIKRWEDVPLPDWRLFYGWAAGALDLAGEWRFMRDDRQEGFAAGWTLPNFDDADWVRLHYPGDALVYGLVTRDRPLWMRKTVAVPAGRFPQKVYLSLAPLSAATVQVFVNGQPLGSLDPRFHTAHTWGQFDVTEQARAAGSLTVVLRLAGGDAPNGPVFLTPQALEAFPGPEPRVNALRWDAVEFVDWALAETVGKTLSALRSVEPDRPIKVHAYGASPWGWKTVARYGGFSHHTGSGPGWAYTEPKQYGASRNLQDSSEPGGPMSNLRDLQGLWGSLVFMGKNAHDYFISLQSITHDPQMRAFFEQKLPAIKVMGRANVLVSPIGVIRGSLNCGYEGEFARWEIWRYGVNPARGGELIPLLDEVRLRDGDLGRFRAIVDEGTPCWDGAMAAALRTYVEQGGVLVLNGLSGRHSFVQRDAGPGPNLAGVRLAGAPQKGGTITWAETVPGLPGLTGEMPTWERTGLGPRSLEPLPGTEVVGRWPDNSAAVTRRALGKGWVLFFAPSQYSGPLLDALAAAYGPDTFASVTGSADLLRTLRSNNGCEDLLMVRGLGKEATVRWTLDHPPGEVYDPVTGQAVPAAVEGTTATFRMTLPDWDFAWFAVRRPDPKAAFSHWLTRQTEIWSGAAPGVAPPAVPLYRHMDLCRDWKLVQVDTLAQAVSRLEQDDATAGLQPTELLFWDTPGMTTRTGPGVVGLYRRTFDLPAAWRSGSQLTLSVQGQIHDSRLHGLSGDSLLYLNGTKLWEGKRLDREWFEVTALLKPTGNRLQIVHQGQGVLAGILLTRSAVPASVQSLAGPWRAVTGLNTESEATLPGPVKASFVYRDVVVPAAARDQEVWLRVQGSCNWAIINGRLRYWDIWGVPTFPPSQFYEIDLTPDLRWGAANRLVLGTGAALGGWKPAELEYKQVELAFYRPGQWAADGKGTRTALSASELAAVARDAAVVRQYSMVHPLLPRPERPLLPAGADAAPLTLPPVLLDLDMTPASGAVADRGPHAMPLTVRGNVEPFTEAEGKLKGIYLRGESANPGTLELPPTLFRQRMEGKSATLRVWVKPLAIDRAGGSLLNWCSYLFGWNLENNRAAIWLQSAPERRLIVESAIRQRVWQSLTLVMDGPRGTLYLDGIPIGTQTWDQPLPGTDTPLYVGSITGNREFLNAKLAAFTIYEGALAAADVARLYARERDTYQLPRRDYPEDDLFRLAVTPGGVSDATELPAQIERGAGVAPAREGDRDVLTLDGQASYLIVRENQRVGLLFAPFTLLLDFRPEVGASGMIFRRHHSLCLGLEKDGTLVFDANIGRRNLIRFPQAVRPGGWNRVAFSYDGQVARLSVNGQRLPDQTYPGSLASSSYPLVFFADNTYPGFPRAGNVACSVRELRLVPGTVQEP